MKALLAVDDTEQSWDAVEFAREFLDPSDEVIVLNVAHREVPGAMTAAALPAYGTPALGAAGYVAPAAEETVPAATEMSQANRAEGERTAAHAAEAVAGSDTAVRFGDPASRIIETASEHDTDLIITGTHDRNAVKRFFFGSVSRDVLEGAPCSVLIVR